MTIHFEDAHLTVHVGDCRAVMASLPDESVHCVVTSPPYWGLRDYGTATWEGGDADCDHKNTNYTRGSAQFGSQDLRESHATPMGPTCRKCGAVRIDSQLGLEPTPEAYVANMVAVFREVRRVLRSDGTVWLNLGDSYAGGAGGRGDSGNAIDGKPTSMKHDGKRIARDLSGLKPKDLVGIPWRVAFALQADGWYLRSDIIWAKPNPMPESVTDRPTKAHEYLFLLTKSARYFYDAEAVREPLLPATVEREKSGYNHAFASQFRGSPTDKRHPDGKAIDSVSVSSGRNLRSVWTIATQPYPGAHFATFPEKLVEPCVKAGTSERGVCPECGAPWERVVAKSVEFTSGSGRAGNPPSGKNGSDYEQATSGTYDVRMGPSVRSETTGWRRSCVHDAEPVPATVLDPFAGSGTVGLVANRLGRGAILIDLSADYIDQAMARNVQSPLGLGA